MKPRCFAIALLATTCGASAANAADARHPTVVELFQSQGCSSCPPANANVNALATRPDILALSFAVTYWDGLGWKDSFARSQYTDRQWAYARAFGNAQVWTPQIVVNGRATVVGNKRVPLLAAIAANDRGSAGPVLDIADGKVAISGITSRPADIWLARYDPRSVEVAIKAGENGGRTLPHRNIVHELVRIGRWTGGTASFAMPAARTPGLATASFVQIGPGGLIVAAVRSQ